MSSESSDDASEPANATASTPDSSKRTRGKVPRKFNKAAREKMKRDQMNELFLELGKTIEIDHSNNGKATTLRETIRLLGELLAQVNNLKSENSTLSSESNYVTVERNELLEETSSLNAEIKRLQEEINERAKGPIPDASIPLYKPPTQLPEGHVAFPLVNHVSDPTPLMGPVYVLPLQPQEPKGFASSLPEMNMAKGVSSISRPQPRYPSSTDSWSTHVLAKPANVVEDA